MPAPLLVVDTSALYAVADGSDDDHNACDELLGTFTGELVVPTPVVVESSWLICDRLGAAARGQLPPLGHHGRATT